MDRVKKELDDIVGDLCKKLGPKVEAKKDVICRTRERYGVGREEFEAATRRFVKRKRDSSLEKYLEKYSWFSDPNILQIVADRYMDFNNDASELSVSEHLKPVKTTYLDIRRSQREEWRRTAIAITQKGKRALKSKLFHEAYRLFSDALRFDPQSEEASRGQEEAKRAIRREPRRGFPEKDRNNTTTSLSTAHIIPGTSNKRKRPEESPKDLDQELRERLGMLTSHCIDHALLQRIMAEASNSESSSSRKKKKKKKKKRKKKDK